jgi:nitrite reductase/ring-hydroxylating ferredoxin subunit
MTGGGERRVGLVHALVNDVALMLYVGSWRARRKGRRAKGTALGLAGLSVLSVGGWLGGHLAYANGVGVDTTAFQQLPADWTDAAAATDVPSGGAIAVDVDGVQVLLANVDGHVVALADRCTHRGGPLHEGSVCDGKVTCPWHGSEFSLTDGAVEHGPAVRPQPAAEARVVDGRVQIRRPDEPA